jgi:hypothetical protein
MMRRRYDRRRYAIALGNGFYPALLRGIHDASVSRVVMVGAGQLCLTIAQAMAIAPRGALIVIMPGHREELAQQ